VLKRILLTTDAVGGVWRYSMELAAELVRHDAEVILAVLGPAPEPPQRREAASIPGLQLVATGLPLDWLAEAPGDVGFAAEVLAAMARQLDVDTVQLHAPALVGDAAWPVPVVVVAHSCVGTWWRAVRGGPFPPDLAWRAEAARVGLQRADGVIAPSASFAQQLAACYGLGRKIEVVWNGRTRVDVEAVGERQLHAICAGRLWDMGKGISDLDAAAARLSGQVLAAGPTEGPNGARIVCRHLNLLGVLDEEALAEEYARAAVFVSPALYEPFGLAVLEAAQAGCALLLADIPVFRELWDGAAIFVDRRYLGAELSHLLSDGVRCRDLGARARRRAARYTAARMANATWTVHQQILSRGRVAA
jgi:glycosyltransferase involved in cell wall biosynthesis